MTDLLLIVPQSPKVIGIASDHGGSELRMFLSVRLRDAGHDLIDFGDRRSDDGDDYPDYVVPLARAVASGDVERGIAICGTGIGATIAANKIKSVRACLIHDTYSAHQGVEDDDMNIICLGGRVVGQALAWELVQAFLRARFIRAERHTRRLSKISAIE